MFIQQERLNAVLRLTAKLSSVLKTMGLTGLRNRAAEGADTLLLRLDRPPLTTEVQGVRLAGYFRHARFLKTVVSNGFESLAQTLFLQQLQPGTVVVDGGAHIGLYTLLACQRLAGRGQIYAFEPDPINYRTLVYNVARCPQPNVYCLPQALADTNGSTTFRQGKSSLSGSLLERRDVEQAQSITVQTTTLDTILGDQPLDRLLIKLDLEGAEPLAVQGMNQALHRAKTVALFLEVNPGALNGRFAGVQRMLNQLFELGVQVQSIDEQSHQLFPVTHHTTLRKGNLYCTKFTEDSGL
jgi:FkbM family methyltransferase